jgi:hypothetical protein
MHRGVPSRSPTAAHDPPLGQLRDHSTGTDAR